MIDGEEIINLIHQEVYRAVQRVTRRTAVAVDSYDKETHAVKLKLMPDSMDGSDPVVTGWIPLHPVQTGNNFGWHAPPNIGDHGWLEFSEFDREAANFTHAVFNDKFKPDKTVEAGELKYIHKTGTIIYFDKNGNVTIQGMNNSNANNGTNTAGSGASQTGTSSDNSKQKVVLNKDGSVLLQDKSGNAKIKLDSNGNIVIDCANFTVVGTGSVGLKAASNLVVKAGGKLGIVADGEAVWQSGGDVADNSVTGPGGAPSVPSFQTP